MKYIKSYESFSKTNEALFLAPLIPYAVKMAGKLTQKVGKKYNYNKIEQIGHDLEKWGSKMIYKIIKIINKKLSNVGGSDLIKIAQAVAISLSLLYSVSVENLSDDVSEEQIETFISQTLVRDED